MNEPTLAELGIGPRSALAISGAMGEVLVDAGLGQRRWLLGFFGNPSSMPVALRLADRRRLLAP